MICLLFHLKQTVRLCDRGYQNITWIRAYDLFCITSNSVPNKILTTLRTEIKPRTLLRRLKLSLNVVTL